MDVMALAKTHATPPEAAAAVAVVEDSAQSRRNRARPRADFDNPSVRIVPHDHGDTLVVARRGSRDVRGPNGVSAAVAHSDDAAPEGS
jgi:hypothetical protein